MITCGQCNAQNSPDRLTCEKCNADLLPPPNKAKRTKAIIKAVLLGLLIILVGFLPSLGFLNKIDSHSRQCVSVAYLIMLIGFIVMLRGVLRALRPPQIYEKYLERASSLAQVDSNQAVADYVHAVMLSPINIRQEISRRLPKKLKELIYPNGNLPDFTLPTDTSPESIKKSVYTAYINWAALSERIPEYVHATEMGFEAGWESAKQKEKRAKWVETTAHILSTLSETGLVKKLSYCSKCGEGVEMDKDGYCPNEKKHGRTIGIVYAPADEADLICTRLKQINNS